MKALNISGQTFGRLTALSPSQNVGGRRTYVCQCSCGATHIAKIEHLRSGITSSCGCYRSEQVKTRHVTHGHSANGVISRTLKSYNQMLSRCLNPNADNYSYYGGRGIVICYSWLQSFENFLTDMGERPEGKTLDRADSNGNYEPGNCQWATAKQQASNRRKRNK